MESLFPLRVTALSGNVVTLPVAESDTVSEVKSKVQDLMGVASGTCRLLVVEGGAQRRCELRDDKILSDYELHAGSDVRCLFNICGGAMGNVTASDQGFAYGPCAEAPILNQKSVIKVDSMKLSCKSEPLQFEADMVGMVLWSYGGLQDWTLNGVHCRAGYVYMRKTSNIARVESSVGQVHGKLYKDLFGCEPLGVVGTGFTVQRGTLKWRSGVFNTGTTYHNSDREAGPLEREVILKIVHCAPSTIVPLAGLTPTSSQASASSSGRPQAQRSCVVS